MLKMSHRSLVGRSTAQQCTGVLQHPTQEIVVIYALSSTASAETFLSYFTEQFEHETVANTLEFHQLFDRCLTTAARMEVGVSLAAVWRSEEQVVLAAYHASIWLKRGEKQGQILTAETGLQLIEGHTQKNDVYVLFTNSATSLMPIVQEKLCSMAPAHAYELLEDPKLHAAVTGSPEENLMGIATIEVSQEGREDSQEVQSVITASEDVSHAPAQSPRVHALSIVHGLKNALSQLRSEDEYVRQQTRKVLLRVAVIAVVLLMAIIGGVVYLRMNQAKNQAQLNATLQPFTTQLEAIKTLSLSDTVKARQNTEQLIGEMEAEAQKAGQPKFIQTALLAEVAEVKEYYQSISGQEELPVLPTFFDLRLVQSNFLASKIDATIDTLFFLDAGQKKILALNIEKKQPTLLPIGEYPDIRAVTADEKYLYFLGEGLFRFTLSGTDVATLVKDPDDTIKTGQMLGLFDRYLYVMNRTQNNIFRYDTSDEGDESKPVGWVQSGQGIDFMQVQSMAIDGDVWLTTQTGEVQKLTGGKVSEFAITGLKEPFSSPITLFTKPDLTNLYILEPQKSRMVVLNKSGQFIKEVKSNNLAGATAVVASEKYQKAFALSGSLVYEMGL